MSKQKIFDENGNELQITDVITRFLKEEADNLDTRYDSIKVGIEYAFVLQKDRLYVTKNNIRMNSFEIKD